MIIEPHLVHPQINTASLTIHHLAIKASRVVMLADFYERVLGLTQLKTHLYSDGSVRSIWLQAGRTILMIESIEDTDQEACKNTCLNTQAVTPPQTRDMPEQSGLHLLAFTIAKNTRDTWQTHLKTNGISISHESDYSLYFNDPDGNRLALSHYDITD